ncbi:MAG: dihydroneopterin aldolase family protein [Thermoplasmata archaeon]|nr:dihydroneopterin aldolase family protein [Thermoplasmata archaeon]
MSVRSHPAAHHRASLSTREALLFEAGIKLGGLFHQYLGTPLDPSTAAGLARTIEQAVGLQPYVVSVKVRIHPERGGAVGRGAFGYRYLTAEMLSVRIVLGHGAVRVVARLEHRPELRYPLMSVERVAPEPGPVRAARRSGRRSGPSARRSSTSGG